MPTIPWAAAPSTSYSILRARMGDPVVAGVDFVGDVQIPTIASASLTAALRPDPQHRRVSRRECPLPLGERRRRSNC
jgi:hypothetical protein